jgi:hypothetical protein
MDKILVEVPDNCRDCQMLCDFATSCYLFDIKIIKLKPCPACLEARNKAKGEK